MSRRTPISGAVLLAAVALGATGCEEEKKPEPKAKPSAAPVVAPPPKPTAKPEPEVQHDCPEKSKGTGSFNKPCEAKGSVRQMEVKWTGKMKDDGPSFRVKNIAKLPILYGKMYAYFYDNAGKQLMVKDGEKEIPAKTCAGKIFQGPMKVDEKAVITFSCVAKDHVPEGTKFIEAEMQMVGYIEDPEDKKTKFYWRNKDLTPDERKKGAK